MFETQFSSVGDFLDMGGYAFNVWSVYALFILFFFINLYYPLLRKKQILKEQKRRQIVNSEMQSGTGQMGTADQGNDPLGESSETS